MMMKKTAVMLSLTALAVGGLLATPSFGDVTVTFTASTAASSPTAVAADDFAMLGVDCPSGEVAVGGGMMHVESNGADLTNIDIGAFQFLGSRPKASGAGWEVHIRNAGIATHYVKVYARCV
jgi:type 1 fimbria pilin